MKLPSLARPLARTRYSVLPGYGLCLGYVLAYLSLVVLLPLSAAFLKAAELDLAAFWATVSAPRVLAAYRLSLLAALAAALVNAGLGLLIAWVLVRYRFPGRKLLDALVDLPFALPTAVAGIALAAVWSGNGPLKRFLEPLGLQLAYTPAGVVLALVFIGLPFVVRTVQPVLAELDPEVEEAAACLGASPWQGFTRIVLPAVLPAVLTGFTLAFARALGEYGSVIFIAGNIPLVSEIAPLVIITKLEQYDVAGATAVAVVLLVLSFGLLLAINVLQAWAARRGGRRA